MRFVSRSKPEQWQVMHSAVRLCRCTSSPGPTALHSWQLLLFSRLQQFQHDGGVNSRGRQWRVSGCARRLNACQDGRGRGGNGCGPTWGTFPPFVSDNWYVDRDVNPRPVAYESVNQFSSSVVTRSCCLRVTLTLRVALCGSQRVTAPAKDRYRDPHAYNPLRNSGPTQDVWHRVQQLRAENTRTDWETDRQTDRQTDRRFHDRGDYCKGPQTPAVRSVCDLFM